MITTLLLTKVMDYIFFIALVWVAFFIYGIIKRVSTGSPVELSVLFIITEGVALVYLLFDANNLMIGDWITVIIYIGLIIWEYAGIIKYKKKKLAEK